jgi:hypothetical protein
MAEPNEVGKVLLQAVDEGLSVLGEIVRAVIYERIERSYHLKREEIPRKLETFHRALQDLLSGGSRVMEIVIAENLYRRLRLNFAEHANWNIVDYVNHAKKGWGSD